MTRDGRCAAGRDFPTISRAARVASRKGPPAAARLTRDARQALFVADGETDEVFELYASPLPQSSSKRPRSK